MSDFTLYNISQNFENLVDLIERDVLEDWEVEDLKRRLASEIQLQSKDIIKFYVNEMADIESLGAEIKRLQIIKSAKTAKIERFKDRLSENMRTLNVKKIATPLGNITLALDSVEKKVEEQDNFNIEDIPEKYVRVKKELNKVDVKKALDNGEVINGVRLIESPSRVRFMLGKESKDFIAEAGE